MTQARATRTRWILEGSGRLTIHRLSIYAFTMASEMREPTYFLMAALLGGPLHGYAIAQKASELSEGRVRLTAGTLYGALVRLVKQGFMTETGEEFVAGRKRRTYELTDRGREALSEDAARMRTAAAIVEARTTIPLAKTTRA